MALLIFIFLCGVVFLNIDEEIHWVTKNNYQRR